MPTQKDLIDAIESLEDGLELFIVRGSEARWRRRQGLYFDVDLDHAKTLLDELSDYYHIRTGVNPPRRVLTSERTEKELPRDLRRRRPRLEDWVSFNDFRQAFPITRNELRTAERDEHITVELREAKDRLGRTCDLKHVRVDNDLARYLADRGHEGLLLTHDGRLVSIDQYRPDITLSQPAYSYDDLADLVGHTTTYVRNQLNWRSLPEKKNGRAVHLKAGPKLAAALEDAFTVNADLPEPATP